MLCRDTQSSSAGLQRSPFELRFRSLSCCIFLHAPGHAIAKTYKSREALKARQNQHMAKNTLLFVYGSLLKGESDHSFLRHSDCLGPSTTKVGYRLVELGAFPALIETGDKAIEGELYSVTHEDLMAIDAHK